MHKHPELNKILQSIRDLTDLDGGRRDLAGTLGRAAELARTLTGAPAAWAGVTVDDKGVVGVSRSDLGTPLSEPWEGPGRLGRQATESGELLDWNREDSTEEPSPGDMPGCDGVPGRWLGMSLALPGSAEGVIAVLDPETDEAFVTVAAQIRTALDNLLAYQRTEALALTDELTRLYNFRFLKTALRREMERAARYGQVFSIIMIDVDHLKQYNDTYGHLGGSELLRQLARILSASSRAIDLVAKYGGDEFLVILPQTRMEGAMAMADRIRAAVAETAFPHAKPGDLTVSVGVASFPQHGDTIESLVGAADSALFRAKRVSRNVVVAADSHGDYRRDRPEAA